jgi:hypothetical protein
MGPRQLRRGKYLKVRNNCIPYGLQWGHAFSGVEIRLMAAPIEAKDLLQWGHAYLGVEILAATFGWNIGSLL